MKLSAIYTGSCARQVGVIVGVDDDQLTLLDLKGEFRKVSRYEIIYMAYYPLGRLPVRQIRQKPGDPLPYLVKTTFAGELRPLVEGWPLDFDENQISFLALDGHEQVIDRNAIWDLQQSAQGPAIQVNTAVQPVLKLTHPYPFAYCPNATTGQSIDPQFLLGEPLMIKKELDQLNLKFSDLDTYEKDKRFYAVPQVYRNQNKIGLWFSSGSRYGASKNRSNNFAPVFESELSEGPFGFQRILVTGSARMNFSLSGEPQNQFYYRLKSDYVHFSFLFDIERIFLGEESYKWQADELGSGEARMNEIQHLGGGFDYGHWAVGYNLASMQYGVKVGTTFFRSRVAMDRPHLIYHHRWLKAELYYGHLVAGKVNNLVPAKDSDTPEQIAQRERLTNELAAAPDFLMTQQFYRLNLYPWPGQGFHPEVSLIRRNMAFEREANTAESGESPMVFNERNSILSLAAEVELFRDLLIKGFFSLEHSARRSGALELGATESHTYFKMGTRMTLIF